MSPSASSKRPRRLCRSSGSSSCPGKFQKRSNDAKIKKVAGKLQAKKAALKVSKAIKTRRRKFPITQRRQSPIDIRSDVVCHDPEHCKPDSLNINYTVGDCHDVVCSATGFKVNVGRKCTTTLSASHLPGTFELAQFHAHWSKDGSCGSEHLLDGKAMSGEVHFVFWNTKYGTFSDAAEKEDGLAVVGVFIKEGAHSANYEPLFNVIHKAIGSTSPVLMPKDFVLDQLFPPPGQRDYVTYLGSLTTPPYSESVIWTVLTTPVEVSKDQLNILRKIVGANYRECQQLCERTVRASGVKV
ncbi:carbonate dehydratase, eukaryotic-type [Necator americanus]|uniref:Carbonate dehydratase, eukaryotic-type n=1 Tax=Necator americanus TaxID=51031 RepID=W2TU13_NECAM|nr:carbonate dehydratase, eukaryotic-type [Necator americanus]ETN85139.1 carbonate dehydratase, eukaryotic-type [Necator americanus]